MNYNPYYNQPSYDHPSYSHPSYDHPVHPSYDQPSYDRRNIFVEEPRWSGSSMNSGMGNPFGPLSSDRLGPPPIQNEYNLDRGNSHYLAPAMQSRIQHRIVRPQQSTGAIVDDQRTCSILCMFRNAPNDQVQLFDDDSEIRKMFFKFDKVVRMDKNQPRTSVSVKYSSPTGAARAVKGLHNQVVRENGAVLKVKYYYETYDQGAKAKTLNIPIKSTLPSTRGISTAVPKKNESPKTIVTGGAKEVKIADVIECPKEALYCYVCDRSTFNTAESYASHLTKPKHKEARVMLSARNRAMERLLQTSAVLADKQVLIKIQNLTHQIETLKTEIGGFDGHPKKTKYERLITSRTMMEKEKSTERLAYENFQEDRKCSDCSYDSANPIDHENHMCSLEHVKKSFEKGQTLRKAETSNQAYSNGLQEISVAKENAELCPVSLENPPVYDKNENFGLEYIEEAKSFWCTVCHVPVKPDMIHSHSKTLSHFNTVMADIKARDAANKMTKKGKKKTEVTNGKKEDEESTAAQEDSDEENEEENPKGELEEEENLKGELDESGVYHDFILNDADDMVSESDLVNAEDYTSMLEDVAEDYNIGDLISVPINENSEEPDKEQTINGGVSLTKVGRGKKRVTEESTDDKSVVAQKTVATPRTKRLKIMLSPQKETPPATPTTPTRRRLRR